MAQLLVGLLAASTWITTSTAVQAPLAVPKHLSTVLSALPTHIQPSVTQQLQKLVDSHDDLELYGLTKDGVLFVHDPAPLLPKEPLDRRRRDTVHLNSFPRDASNKPLLHSYIGATHSLYIDFDGHSASDDSAYKAFDALPFSKDSVHSSYTDEEALDIIDIHARVSEDFSIFDIDVTTSQPIAMDGTVLHVLVTSRVQVNGEAMPFSAGGGYAFIGTFGRADYHTKFAPALVFDDRLFKRSDYIAEAVSHEAGHQLGLTHMGVFLNGVFDTYYKGANQHSVIMGSSYGKQYSLWSKGDYVGATNKQDNIAIMAARLGFRADEPGSTLQEAVLLDLTSPAVTDGIVGFEDVDWFVVDAKGELRIEGQPFATERYTRGSNLHMIVNLFNSAEQLVASDTANYNTGLVNLSTIVTPGRYYISIAGTGHVDVFPAYASSGQYQLTITGTSWDPTTSTTTVSTSTPVSETVALSSSAALSIDLSTSGPATSTGDATVVELPCTCPSTTEEQSNARNKKWRVRFRTSCSAYQFQACLAYDPESGMDLLLQLEHKTGGSYVVKAKEQGKHGEACISLGADGTTTAFKSKWRYRVVNPGLLQYKLSYKHARVRSNDC